MGTFTFGVSVLAFVGGASLQPRHPAMADASSLPIDAGAYEFQPVPLSNDCLADLALPSGVLDLAGVDAFIASFLAGCP